MSRLTVEVFGDASHFERTLRDVQRSARRFDSAMSKVQRGAAAVGVGIGFGAVVKGLKDSIDAASNLNEQMSASQVVFGDSAAQLDKWSRSAATAMGLARDQAMQAAASFGGLARAAGLTGDAAVTQVEELIQRGADLASLYNTDVQSALDAIRSGIVGEAEPLRKYNVLLSEAKTQQEALRETGKKSATELTQQEKAYARLTLILRDSNVAAGNFADTSDQLANQQRIATANIRNFQILLGTKLVPTLTNVLIKFNEWAEDEDNQARIADTIDRIGAAIERVANAAERLGRAEAKTKSFFDRLTGGLNDAMAAWAPGWPLIVEGLDKLSKTTGGGLVGPVGGGGDFGPTGLPVGGAGAGMPGFTGKFNIPSLRAPRGATVEQRNQWFDAMIGRMLGRVGDVDLREQISRLNQIADLLRQRIAATKDVTRQLNLEDQLADVILRTRQTRTTLADLMKSRAEDAKEAARAAKQAAQDTKLGWLEFALERAEATKPIGDNRKALRAIEKFWEELIRREGRNLERARELWRVREQIRDLNKSKADVDPLAGLMQVSSGRLAVMLAAGTGLGAHGQRILSANVSALEIQSYVHIDGREVGRAVNRDQARTSRRTARQTSGYRG